MRLSHALLFPLTAALGCAARERPEAPVAFDFATRAGVAQIARDTTSCLTIANPALSPGAALVLVSPGPTPRIDSAWVQGRRDAPCSEPGDEWGSVLLEGAAWYTLRLAPGAEPVTPAIGLLGPVGSLVIGDSTVAGDLEGDGREERFEICASAEGLHLSIVTPTGQGPERRWQQYYYLPYDIEPDCPASVGSR